MPAAERMRLATYNVRRCVGLDGRQDPDRILQVLEGLDADVIALQEIDSESDHHADGTLEQFAEALQMRAIAGPALRRGTSGYGNGLLTRAEITRVRRHDLSVVGREPRGAIEAELKRAGASWVVVATHLGLRHRERIRQARRLHEHLVKIRSACLVAMGDFNEWLPCGAIGRRFRRAFGCLPAPATYPANRPLLALDRIWVEPAARLRAVTVVHTALTRVASDHLPLVAEIVIGPDVAARG